MIEGGDLLADCIRNLASVNDPTGCHGDCDQRHANFYPQSSETQERGDDFWRVVQATSKTHDTGAEVVGCIDQSENADAKNRTGVSF